MRFSHVYRVCAVTAMLVGSMSYGSNLANPGLGIPPARLALGASYHVGGYPITGREVPMIMNRVHAHATFSLLKYIDIGVEAGTSQIEVASYTDATDTIQTFHGNYGFSGGAHLKLVSPPLVKDLLSAVVVAQATAFSSANTHGARYGGYDGAGAAGLQLRIPRMGSVSAGAKMYLIEGSNKGYQGTEGEYSNVDNLRGWIAVDFLPTFKEDVKGKPYFTFEASVSPDTRLGGSVPLKGAAFSLAVGWISPRLYGEDFEDVQ